MKRPTLRALSLMLNLLFVLAFLLGAGWLRFFQTETVMDVYSWASYAGVMQACADDGVGERRFYRPMLTDLNGPGRSHFTGQTEQGERVWTWPYYQLYGYSGKAGADAFTNAYNRRMLNFISNPKSFQAAGVSATQRAK
jgi:hypothetical protein